jgi:exopolysaccharide production protein ExoQ
MAPIVLAPFVQRLLTVFIFLLLPTALLGPHGVVWEIIVAGFIGLYYGQKHQLADFPKPLMAALLAFPLWGLVTALWAEYPLAAALMSLKVLSLIILGVAWCRFTLSLHPDAQKPLLNALIAGLLMATFLLFINCWMGNTWQHFWHKDTSKAFSQGSLIMSLAAWPTALWILQRPYSFLFRASLIIALLLGVFWSLFQMDCDTSYMGLFLGLIVFASTLIFPRLTARGMRLFVPLFIILFPIVSLYAFKPAYMPTYNTYIQSASYLDRLYIWNEVATTIVDHPWKGIGMDGTAFHEKRQIAREWLFTDKQGKLHKVHSNLFGVHPHNAILQLWLELGFFGVILGVVLTNLVLRQIYLSHLTTLEKAFSAGLFTGTFLIVWVSLGFWQNWWIAGLWMIIGLTITMFNNKRDIHERNRL